MGQAGSHTSQVLFSVLYGYTLFCQNLINRASMELVWTVQVARDCGKASPWSELAWTYNQNLPMILLGCWVERLCIA